MSKRNAYVVFDISDLQGVYLGTAFTRNELIKFTDPNIHSKNEDGHWNIADPDALNSCQDVNTVTAGYGKNVCLHMRLCDTEFLEKDIRIYPTRNDNQRTWLVRGIGKRAIKVSAHPFGHLLTKYATQDQIIVNAAMIANKRGWKKCFVSPDGADGEYAEVYNTMMVRQFHKGNISGGFPVCYVGYHEY